MTTLSAPNLDMDGNQNNKTIAAPKVELFALNNSTSVPTLPKLTRTERSKGQHGRGGARPIAQQGGFQSAQPTLVPVKNPVDAKAAARSAAERDRKAREKAARVKAFMEERDKLRPPLSQMYLKAIRSTMDLDPQVRTPRKKVIKKVITKPQSDWEDPEPLADPGRTSPPPPKWPYQNPSKSDPFQAPPKKKQAKRRKKGDVARKGVQLLKASDTAMTTAGFDSRVAAQTGAAEQFLEGLHDWPDDERLAHGFDVAVQSVKMYDGQQRWGAWPFAGSSGRPEQRAGGSAPHRMNAPTLVAVTHNSVDLAWDPASNCAGYDLEIADFDALDGQQEWRRVYHGPKLQALVGKLGRHVIGVRARVRAYNGVGKGEWSPRTELLRLAPIPPKKHIEIEEIPGEWLTIDLAGVPELSAKDVNPALLQMVKADLVKGLHANRTLIKVAFRYYALAGVNNVDDDPSTMTMVQFGNFCRGAQLLDDALSSSDIDRIFLRSIRSRDLSAVASDGADAGADDDLVSALAATGLKATSGWKKAKAAVNVVGISSMLSKGNKKEMTQSQFVASLIRITAHKYPQPELSLAEKITLLVRSTVENHVLHELQLIEDDFNPRMRTRAMGAVLHKHAAQLQHVFISYAQADRGTAEARRALSTMNVLECNELFEDAALFDKTFTAREMLGIFVKVNIDDDLYYAEKQNDSSSASELDFDEFEEVIARCFNACVWARTQSVAATASLLDQDGDGDLDADDADDLFDECDVDGSGSITPDELHAALAKRLNDAAAKLVGDQLFSYADKDGSGSVSREELRDAIQHMMSSKTSGKEQAEALERGFDAWLGGTFLPQALVAVKQKKHLQVKQ